MFGMDSRIFLVQRFIIMLIVIRVFTTHLFPLEVFVGVVLSLFVVQYYKEGLTPLTLLILPVLALSVYGQITESIVLQYFVSILGGLIHYLPVKMYWLPQNVKKVGFREDVLEGQLHYYQFFPLDQSKQIVNKQIKWHYGKQVSKMLEYKQISNRLLKKIGQMTMSYADQHQIKIGEGSQLKTNVSIPFCHGRTGTPFMYSMFFLHFSGNNYKVGAVQHNEVSITGLTERAQIKKFREKEVQVRAAEYYQTILKVNNERLILMGHSYGCATVIQAYHTLEQDIKKKVSHIVLLDPWFFPLTLQKFSQPIKCPVLILANQDFVGNEDIYIRNKEFLEVHKNDQIEYITWKNGHHLHQTDMGFINGNLLGAVKNSHLSKHMLEYNLQAIDKFLEGEKVEGAFGEKDIGRNYRPQKFHPEKELTF